MQPPRDAERRSVLRCGKRPRVAVGDDSQATLAASQRGTQFVDALATTAQRLATNAQNNACTPHARIHAHAAFEDMIITAGPWCCFPWLLVWATNDATALLRLCVYFFRRRRLLCG